MGTRRFGRAVVLSWGLGAFGATAASACSDDAPATSTASDAAVDAASDATSASDADDGAATCTLPASYGSPECNECMRTECCGPITACEADPDCKVLAKCITDCLPVPDAGGCRQGCLDTYPTSRALWDTLEGCWFATPTKTGCIKKCS